MTTSESITSSVKHEMALKDINHQLLQPHVKRIEERLEISKALRHYASRKSQNELDRLLASNINASHRLHVH